MHEGPNHGEKDIWFARKGFFLLRVRSSKFSAYGQSRGNGKQQKYQRENQILLTPGRLVGKCAEILGFKLSRIRNSGAAGGGPAIYRAAGTTVHEQK